MLNEAIGGIQNRLGGPVIFGQNHPFRLLKVGGKIQKIAQRRPPELVDTLVVITDDGDILVALGQQAEQLKLNIIGVLKLVHQDVFVAFLIFFQNFRMRSEQPERKRHQIAEIEKSFPEKKRLIPLVRRRQFHGFRGRLLAIGNFRAVGCRRLKFLGVGLVLFRRDVLVLRAGEEGQQCVDMLRRIAERAVIG